MSAINQCQKIRSSNWDKAMGSFKPSKRHQPKTCAGTTGTITRRKGRIIRESYTWRLRVGETVVAELWI